MARGQNEFMLCCAIADQLWLALDPSIPWSHFPLGENRSAATGYRLKRMGTRAGWPDYLIAHAGTMILLEAKADDGDLTQSQIAMFPLLEIQGFPVHVVRSLDDLEAVLDSYGVPLRSRVRPRRLPA